MDYKWDFIYICEHHKTCNRDGGTCRKKYGMLMPHYGKFGQEWAWDYGENGKVIAACRFPADSWAGDTIIKMKGVPIIE